jgi:DNA-directed RNA polymerase specialized sigma24 family protein
MPENGPGENFTDLHNRLYGKVFSFVHMRIKDKEEVKDIVQDVFIRAYNSWVKTKGQLPDENTARNFLYVIAKQRMIP